MPTFLSPEDFQLILEAPDAGRRAGLARRLFADFEAGALDDREELAALSIFRATAGDEVIDVRHDFARFVAGSRRLPADIARTIAQDSSRRVAAPFLRHGRALDEQALVDAVGQGETWRQVAIAGRQSVASPVVAALAEVGAIQAVKALLKNTHARLSPVSLARIAERFSNDDCVAELLLVCPGAPGGFVEARIHTVSDRLKAFVDSTGWLESKSTGSAFGKAVEHSLVEFAVGCPKTDLAPIFAKWVAEGRITRGFVLRASCYGALTVLELALSEFAGLPPRRAAALWADARGYGRQSLISRTGFGTCEEAFISRSIFRFAKFDPGRVPQCATERRAAVAMGIEEVITDAASPVEFSILLEQFAADCDLVMLAPGISGLDRAA